MKLLVLTIAILGLLAGSLSALTLFSENFGDNLATLSGWKRSSTTYVTRYTGTPKVGDAAMRIAGANNAITYIKVAPYQSMTISFKLAQSGLTSTEFVRAEYLSGTTWIALKSLYGGGTANTFTTYTGVVVPNQTILQLRFRVSASATTKYGFVDDVVLSGVRK